jgi:hypothetical protein
MKYLSLDDANSVIVSFQDLGTLDLSVNDFFNGELPPALATLEKFVCQVYAPKSCQITSIPKLRWELYRSKNLEGEKLPTTLPTLFLHIMRANFVSRRDKSYTSAHPTMPLLTNRLWMGD